MIQRSSQATRKISTVHTEKYKIVCVYVFKYSIHTSHTRDKLKLKIFVIRIYIYYDFVYYIFTSFFYRVS